MTKAAILCLHTLYAGISNANIDHRQGKAGKEAKEFRTRKYAPASLPHFPLENPLTYSSILSPDSIQNAP
jgi:hypothetical protein